MDKQAPRGAVGCKPLTTFVHTDTNNFREVVQRLTGPAESESAKEGAIPKETGIKRPTSKLHERRQYARPKLVIVKPLNSNGLQSSLKSRNNGFSSSPLGTPSTILSQLSIREKQNKEESAAHGLNNEEEEKAIKEKRFYLHPSPRPRPGHTEPELLTLFPLTSPRTGEKL